MGRKAARGSQPVGRAVGGGLNRAAPPAAPWQGGQGQVGSLFSPLGLDAGWLAQLEGLLQGSGGGRGCSGPPLPVELRRLQGQLQAVTAANARFRLRGWRLVYRRGVLFAFRVAFSADEHRQTVVQALVDPATEGARLLPAGGRWAPFPLGACGTAGSGGYGVKRLFLRAQEALPTLLRRDWSAFCAEVEKRKAQERARIEGYYGALEQQAEEPALRRRLAAERERWKAVLSGLPAGPVDGAGGAGAGSPGASLGAAAAGGDGGGEDPAWRERQRERERRLAELDLRYRPRAEAELVYAAWVAIPQVEFSWRVAHPRRRGVVAVYDLLAGRWLDWDCEICGAPLDRRGVGDGSLVLGDGILACPGCAAPCPGCGHPLAVAEAAGACHLCGAALCPRCAGACPLQERTGLPVQGRAGREGAPVFVCPACRTAHCAWCGVWALGGWAADGSWGEGLGGQAG